MFLQSTDTRHLQHIQLKAHLKSSQTSALELFFGNNQCVEGVGYFRIRPPSVIFDWTLNATLPNNLLYLEEGLKRSFPSLGSHKGILGSPLPPNSLDLHQTTR